MSAYLFTVVSLNVADQRSNITILIHITLRYIINMEMGSGEGSKVRNFINSSPNRVREIKSIRLRWAGHVARMEEGRSAFKF